MKPVGIRISLRTWLFIVPALGLIIFFWGNERKSFCASRAAYHADKESSYRRLAERWEDGCEFYKEHPELFGGPMITDEDFKTLLMDYRTNEKYHEMMKRRYLRTSSRPWESTPAEIPPPLPGPVRPGFSFTPPW